MPATNPLRSATCASTLLAWKTSQRRPSAYSRAPPRAKNAHASECRCLAQRARHWPPARCRAPARQVAVMPQQIAVIAAASITRIRSPRLRSPIKRSASRLAEATARVRKRARSTHIRRTASSGGTVSVIWTRLQSSQTHDAQRIPRLRPVRLRPDRRSALASGVAPRSMTVANLTPAQDRHLKHQAATPRFSDTRRWCAAALVKPEERAPAEHLLAPSRN